MSALRSYVCDHHLGEGGAALSDRGKRRPHAPGPDDQDSHEASVTQIDISEWPKKRRLMRRKGHIPDCA